ncbi:MAG: HAD family hydrolase [Gammaproteobacteria bacterium]
MQTFHRNTIALVYDFDGTLSPQPMQEYTVLPKIGMAADEFWAEVDRQTAATQSEAMLVYMRLLLEQIERKSIHVGREDFTAMAQLIEYFPGVTDWFDRIDKFVAAASGDNVNIVHYMISAGLKEILEGVSIHGHFRRIYASEYHYDHHGVPVFPKVLITDTTKTQYLFRINKGMEQQTDSINEHMPEYQRPIPFANMIYLGDGHTDVPSMTVTRQNGGNAIAVYRDGHDRGLQVCRELLAAKRVNFIAPADYRPGSVLEQRTRLLLQAIISNIAYQGELHACRQEHGIPES